jgi:hypothetical protein
LGELPFGYNAIHTLSISENEKWEGMCAYYLPVIPGNSIWRYSRASQEGDACQGWKLHISATILTANKVFGAAAPYLKSRKILFKAPHSLRELEKINSGLYYGYSQIGKFITVYPRDGDEAVSVARRLHRLTAGSSAPPVPFDFKYRPDGCIYYRYGSFEPLEMKAADGTQIPAMRDRDGGLIPDLRDSKWIKPGWLVDPFVRRHHRPRVDSIANPLGTTFRAFRALAQRGKGGVYKAFDTSASPPRLCILKEGRRDGEISWDGRDGYFKVQHEERVLTSLRAAGVEVPAVYSSFEAQNNYYLVTECIGGETLQEFLSRRRKRLPVARALTLVSDLSVLISRIHSAGWAWRDCKPSNVIITTDGRLMAVDFEGACPIDRPDPTPWGTPTFTPPDYSQRGNELSRKYDDFYALGVVLYYLLAGRLPDTSPPIPLKNLRRNVPREVLKLAGRLLGADPLRRPEAQLVGHKLLDAISSNRRLTPV